MQEAMFNLLGSWLEVSSLPPLLLAVVAIFLLTSSMRRKSYQGWRGGKAKTAPREPAPGAVNTAAGAPQKLRSDLESLMVELQEFTRSVNAQIDNRFAKLEAALRDADRRIAVLNRLSRQLADRTGGAAASEDHEMRHEVIYELADAGFTPVEIARDTGKTPGEVELILNLRRQRASAAQNKMQT